MKFWDASAIVPLLMAEASESILCELRTRCNSLRPSLPRSVGRRRSSW